LLVFVEPAYHLEPAREKAIYDLHQNAPGDTSYRSFLQRLFDPLRDIVPAGSLGLEFGCGPGPVLAEMLTEAGYRVHLYDPFYAPDDGVFNQCYRFVTATEVVEHLYHPGEELARLWQCLEPGGQLALMTKLVLGRSAFAGWHYKNDPTHVCFFSRTTFDWLARHWQAEVRYYGADVIILTKPSGAGL
jgi:2-polyprenyl-3-methyl-5-hydroxy-6-metoxy-1,4-benzoquinol methylase